MKLWVHVRANAKQEKIEAADKKALRVSVKEPPTDGRANEAVLKALARHFDVPLKSVRIVAGAASRRKLIEVLGVLIRRAVQVATGLLEESHSASGLMTSATPRSQMTTPE